MIGPDDGKGMYPPKRATRGRQAGLMVRLGLAALIAALLAVGASYALRTLNL